MSNTTEKTFVDGLWFKEKTFDDGGSLLKVSILASKFGPFVKKHKKDDGFINIVIAKKRIPDERSTHYAYLDTFVPKSQSAPAPKPSPKKVVKKTVEESSDEDDVTF